MRCRHAFGLVAAVAFALGLSPGVARAAAKQPIVIGVPSAQSGPSSSGNDGIPGVAKAWAAYVNKQLKGIAGYPVKVVQSDTKSDPAAALAAVTKLVEDDGIIASVGGTDDPSASAVTQYLQSKGVPTIGGVCYAPVVCGGPPSIIAPNGGNPSFFTVTTTIPASITEQLVAAKDLAKAKTFGVMTCAESPSCASADPLYKIIAKNVGIDYAGLVTVSASDPSYTAACLSLKQKGADVVQLSVGQAVGARIVSDCTKQGYKPAWAASAGAVSARTWEPVSKQIPGFKLYGGLNAFPWFANAAPVKNFTKAMAKYAPGAKYDDPNSTGTWASLELFRTALEQYKSNLTAAPTSQDVFAAMYGLQGENLGGLLPQKMTYAKGQPAPAIDCFYLFQLVNGKFTSPDGGLKSRCENGLQAPK